MATDMNAAEHILVCLSSAPSNANIIRTAAQMSSAFGGNFTALYVQTTRDERMAQEDRQRLQRHIRQAENAGASIASVTGEDVASQIAEFSRLQKVTKVVIGRSASGRNHLFARKPLTERLIEQAPFLEVYIIPDMAGENHRRGVWQVRRGWPGRLEWGVTLLMLLAATAVSLLFSALHFPETCMVTVYILGVLLTSAYVRNPVCSFAASLVSVLLFDLLFTTPHFSLQIDSGGTAVTFVVMLLSALITGTMATRLTEHAKRSVESASRTKVLFETNQLLQRAEDDEAVLRVTAEQLIKLMEREIILYPALDGKLGAGQRYIPEGSSPGNTFSREKDVAHWVLTHKQRAGATTGIHGDARGMYLAIRSNDAVYGVVGVHIGAKPLDPFVGSVLLSILGECALALENHRNAREKEQAAILAKNEQLRADLLRAISHDLRTPLTSISGNAENLLNNSDFMDQESRRRIVADIYDDAIWLIQLVENLLAITRISEGRMHLNMSVQLVEEVVTEALRHIGRKGAAHHITADIRDELMLASMDPRLISQVLINLVDNAIKYTPAGSAITVSTWKKDGNIHIRVADDGPGIPQEAKRQVFDMFYTGTSSVADCHRSLGLGLPLCRSIVEAHGGSIRLTDGDPHGAVFTFTLPASEVTLNE